MTFGTVVLEVVKNLDGVGKRFGTFLERSLVEGESFSRIN